MKDFIELFIFTMICISIFLVYKCYKYYIDEKIRSRISCWLLEDSADLLEYIQVKCVGKTIEDQYLIVTQTERNAAFEIIKAYQEKMKSKYLNDSYTVNFKYVKMTHAEYFMSNFVSFLSEKNDYSFIDNKMYNETSRKYYDKNQPGHYVATCTLTDYGRTYNKLYYMAVLYCEKSAYLNKEHDYYSEGRKKVLDTNETTFYNY